MDLENRERQLGETRALGQLRQQVQSLAAQADARLAAPLAAASRRRRPAWLLVAAAVAVASLAAALVLVGLPALRGGRVVGPEAASAADRMMAKMTSTWATASTISADVEFEMSRDYLKGLLKRRGTFLATAAGSGRLETVNLSTDPEMDDSGVGARKVFVYDAARHRAARLTEPVQGRPSYDWSRTRPRSPSPIGRTRRWLTAPACSACGTPSRRATRRYRSWTASSLAARRGSRHGPST